MHECLARVAVLITGTSLDDFMRFCADFPYAKCPRPPYKFIHFYAYLAAHGYIAGLHIIPESKPDDELKIFRLEHDITTAPALVLVKSEHPSWLHALYWDGSKLIDPMKIGVMYPLDHYVIKSWTPIYPVDG